MCVITLLISELLRSPERSSVEHWGGFRRFQLKQNGWNSSNVASIGLFPQFLQIDCHVLLWKYSSWLHSSTVTTVTQGWVTRPVKSIKGGFCFNVTVAGLFVVTFQRAAAEEIIMKNEPQFWLPSLWFIMKHWQDSLYHHHGGNNGKAAAVCSAECQPVFTLSRCNKIRRLLMSCRSKTMQFPVGHNNKKKKHGRKFLYCHWSQIYLCSAFKTTQCVVQSCR